MRIAAAYSACRDGFISAGFAAALRRAAAADTGR